MHRIKEKPAVAKLSNFRLVPITEKELGEIKDKRALMAGHCRCGRC